MTRLLNEQVVVITGASSGIGREAARLFASRGASLVLAARNEAGLAGAAGEAKAGGRAGDTVLRVPTDVAHWDQVQELARRATERFGRIDTWVNNAAVALYGPVADLTVEEIEQVIQVDLMGQIYGVKAALNHMLPAGQGTIINVGSALSQRSVPLQAAYCAAKHGIKGFTEALRMELAHERSGVNVTLVMPASINTPFFDHARSRMDAKPKPVPPVYEPRIVAEAIVSAAERPKRDIYVGGMAKLLAVSEAISPSLTDRYMVQGGRMFKQQKADQPPDGEDNLFGPIYEPGSVEGSWGEQAKPTSLYTRFLELRPTQQRLVLGAALAGMVLLAARSNQGR